MLIEPGAELVYDRLAVLDAPGESLLGGVAGELADVFEPELRGAGFFTSTRGM